MSPTRSELVSIATSRGVRFEVLEDDQVVDGELLHTGLRIDLLAPSRHGEGCPHRAELACPAVFEDLETIARAVLPSTDPDTSYSLDAFDHSLHIDPCRDYEADIRLSIHFRHRDGSHDPVDASLRRCVAETTAALEELGVDRT